jgi:hypothetical protein
VGKSIRAAGEYPSRTEQGIFQLLATYKILAEMHALQGHRQLSFASVGAIVTFVAFTSDATATTPARAPAKILATLGRIQKTVRVTRYSHRTRINQRRGIYVFDCSAMAGWVLERSAPRARRTLTGRSKRRPVARDFYRSIARLRPGQRRGPWLRLASVKDARPGDILAWIRPRWFPSKHTGHVAFVVSRPKWNTGPVGGWLLRIIDATALPHENDTRRDGRTGFGAGTLLVATDSRGRARGYGWYGSRSQHDWIVPTRIVVGRALR